MDADYRLLMLVVWISGFLLGLGALWLYQYIRDRRHELVLRGPDNLLTYQVRLMAGDVPDPVTDRLAVNTDDLKVAKAERKKLRDNEHDAYLVENRMARG